MARPTRLRAATAPFAFVPCLLIACGTEDRGDVGIQIDTLNGIEHRVAGAAPIRTDVALELMWRAPSEAEVFDGAEWANPTRIAVGEGYLAVLDPQIPRVHLFTDAGARDGSFGRRGEGPGELAQSTGLAIHGDTIVVHGGVQRYAQLFARDGTFLDTWGAVEGLSMDFQSLHGLGVVRASAMLVPGAGSTPRWHFIGWNGERHEFDLPGDHSMQPHVAAGSSGCWRVGSWGRYMVQVDCTFPLVRKVDHFGTVAREHRIAVEPRVTPPDVLESSIEEARSGLVLGGNPPPAVMDQIMRQLEEQVRDRNRWLPVIRGVGGSPSGHRLVIWEQLPESFGGGDAVLHVLDEEGRYLVRHEADGTFAALAVSDEHIYVLAVDAELGLRRLEAYRLP